MWGILFHILHQYLLQPFFIHWICCRFQDARDAIIRLQHWYQELALHEELEDKTQNISDGHSYYTGLAQQVASLAARLEQRKDEL
jgi:hypothetical protein